MIPFIILRILSFPPFHSFNLSLNYLTNIDSSTEKVTSKASNTLFLLFNVQYIILTINSMKF